MVEKKSAGRSVVAFRNATCWLRIVLPLPGTPTMRLMAFSGSPP